ncbi:LLM class F420-dependent oxidoreductase [Actinomadura sp. KC345]|uniref:LLM class F420-dependent oxidoreductase n=1 Tax=Actinomadura sp. KC345 TaxID=2530371 RepID=UPI00104F15A4|nr:LLM class F420-dependent oxidoreductase [Actinomadura sp. KC345]TDC48997.1 LLM class F420-dependent oxidoreductase [Actinomadura sp. KC345]
MRVGLQIPSFTFPGGPEQIGPTYGRMAREADQAGLDSLWVMDHFFQIDMVGPPEDPMLESYSALAYAAALTERITLGTMVTGVTYRHPGILLKTVTTLDVLSGGRAWLGIGAAWYEQEARGLGTPFPPVAERFERLEETLEIAHRMWKGDESAFRGGHYTLERPLNSPPALRRPHPPILIGGGGEKRTLRLVARYADACNLFDGDELPHKLDVLRGHCERESRDFAEIEKTSLGYFTGTPSADEVADTVGRLAESGIDHAIFSQGAGQDLAGVLGEALARTGEIVPAGR